jgi:hypothetical protein
MPRNYGAEPQCEGKPTAASPLDPIQVARDDEERAILAYLVRAGSAVPRDFKVSPLNASREEAKEFTGYFRLSAQTPATAQQHASLCQDWKQRRHLQLG